MVHPIVEALSPSAEQWPAIEDRGRDLLVTAGAGSGKTRTLVARYLSLLAEGLPLRSVVAITFTRKAAREMRNRVRLQVQNYLDRNASPVSGQVDWQDIYVQLDAARISTIHTLCAELLRAHPAEANVDPRFEMLDEAQTALLRAEAVRATLGWAADDPLASTLFGLLGERGLSQLASGLLARRLDAAPLLAAADSPWEIWLKIIAYELGTFLDQPELQYAMSDLMSLRHDGTLQHALSLRDAQAPLLEALLASWDAVCAARASGDWSGVFELLAPMRKMMNASLGRKDAWGGASPKQGIKTLQGLWDQPAVNKLLAGSLAVDRSLAEAMPAVRRLFEQLLLVYTAMREARRALDFDDLERMALDLLMTHADVRQRWQDEVRAILVDEFQDTNRRQFELIHLLNGARGRAFFVGDAKQSIYAFRGADVTVFRHEQSRLAAGESSGGALAVATSYRAHRQLLELLNGMLAPALGSQADDDLLHYREQPAAGLEPPYVELHLTMGPRTGENNAQELAARALVHRLTRLMDQGVQLPDGTETRRLAWSDIAILCRKSTSFGAYEDALDGAGIPFQTVSGRGFYGRPEVRDLLNALRAIADPTDDLALAGLLRSAAIGLSDVALYTLCEQRAADGCTLWELLHDAPPLLDPADGERVSRAVRLVSDLHALAGRTVVADLLKAFLDATDYRAALRATGQGRAVRNVSKLLTDALESDIVGVGEFLEYVTAVRDAATRESEARATAEGAVQIMSVHAAKGLEFPVVVLGDISARLGGHAGMLLDDEAGLILALKHEAKYGVMYAWAKERADRREEEEEARLLYVAATRARELLLLSGAIGFARDGRLKGAGAALQALAGTLGVRAPEGYDEDGAGVRTVPLQLRDLPVGCWVYEPQWSPSVLGTVATEAADVDGLAEPALLAPLEARAAPTSPEDAAEPQRRVWRVVSDDERLRAPNWLVGRLVHAALEAWRFPDERWERWAEATVRTLGVVDTLVQRDAVNRAARLLVRFEAAPLFDAMLRADQRLNEVPYSILGPDGRPDWGVIDALYRVGDAWTLVEFKSDALDGAVARERAARLGHARAEGHLAQVERYRRAAEQLLGLRPQVLLCWLDADGVVVPDVLEASDASDLATTTGGCR